MALATLIAAASAVVLFENPRLRITDVRLAPGEVGGLETHAFPTLRWQVGQGRHRVGAEPEADVADKAVRWVAAGDSFICTNCGDGEYRQICWEFKAAPLRTEARVRELLEQATFTTDVGTELLFENEYCRAWDFSFPPGGGDARKPHHHVLDYAFVYVAKGRLLGSHADGTPGLFDSMHEDGGVCWFSIPEGAGRDDAYAHGGRNGYDDLPMREYLVELK